MFDSKLHDPSASWRSHPATEFQFARLRELGIPVLGTFTKGQAADLIAEQGVPNYEEIEFLEFFAVAGVGTMNQLQARRSIAAIVGVPSNRDRWNNRPAAKKQRQLIEYVDGSVPPNLTFPAAERIICAYQDTIENAARLREFEKLTREAEDRESEVQLIADDIKSAPSTYGLKYVNAWYVRQAVVELEAESGRTVVELNRPFEFTLRVAERIRQKEPNLLTEEAVEHPERFAIKPFAPPPEKRHGSDVGVWVFGGLIVLALLLWLR